MISVTVNGKQQALEGPTTVAAYIDALPTSQRQVAVAKNGEVIPRQQWASTPIEEGDTLEIVRMVGGGQVSSPALRARLGRQACLPAGRFDSFAPQC